MDGKGAAAEVQGCGVVQAGERIRGFTEDQKKRFLENIMMWMADPKTTPEVRRCAVLGRSAQRWICVEPA